MQQRLNNILKPLGFRKRARTWRKPVPYGFVVLEIQKSMFGASSDFNFGIWIEGVDTTRREGIVRWLDCGIRGRLERIGPAAAEVEAWLQSGEPAEQEELMSKELGLALEGFADAAALQQTWRSGKLINFSTTPRARRWLGERE